MYISAITFWYSILNPPQPYSGAMARWEQFFQADFYSSPAQTWMSYMNRPLAKSSNVSLLWLPLHRWWPTSLAPAIHPLSLPSWRNPAPARTWWRNGYLVVESQPDRSPSQFFWPSPWHWKNYSRPFGPILTISGEASGPCQQYKLDKAHPTKNSEVITLSNWLSQGLSQLERLPMDFTTQILCGWSPMSIFRIDGRTRLSLYLQTANGWDSPTCYWNCADDWYIHHGFHYCTRVYEGWASGLVHVPCHTLPGFRVDSVVEPRKRNKFLELCDAETKFNTVFCGSADH